MVSCSVQHGDRTAETFWRGELQGITRPIRFSEQPSTGTEVQVGETQYRLDTQTSDRLRQLAAAYRLTLGSVVMGAWALLHGLLDPSGDDLLLDVSISGRPPTLPGVEGIIGPFLNNVPLRVSFPVGVSTVNWLHGLQERQQAIQTYGYISPLQIQEWSEMPAGSAPYETLFVFQSPTKMPNPGFQMRPESATLETNVPLALSVETGDEGLLLWFAYHQPRYTLERIGQLHVALIEALNLIAAQPDAPILNVLDRLRAVAPVIASSPADIIESNVAIERLSPRNGIEARLSNIWAQVLGHESFGIMDNFFDMGTSSFQAVQLISRIRQSFERELPLATLFSAPTIEHMAQILVECTPLPAWSSLVPIKLSGSKTPLFLVHHGGGGLFGYSDVARYLDADRPLYGLQEPGIEDGQALPGSVEEIAGLYVREIQTVQPHGPYGIGGFCFGGVVAFEMAQQLHRAGEPVQALILLDAIPPGYVPQITLEQRLDQHKSRMSDSSIAGKVIYIGGRIIRRARWEMHRVYMLLRRVYEHTAFHLLEGANRPVPPYIRQRRLLELNGHLNDNYVPGPYAGRTALIRATYPELHYPQDFGWGTLVQPDVMVFQMATEDHLQMLTEPNIHTLVQHLQNILDHDTTTEPDTMPASTVV